MKNKQQLEQWVEEAMNSFDGANRATANPFLFTRIQERLRQQNSPWEKVANFIAKPAFAFAVVVLFLSANFYVASQEKADKLAREKQHNEQLFASEYTTSSNLSNELNPNR
jgi:hypothetical protein